MNVGKLHDEIYEYMEEEYPSFTRLFLSLGTPRDMTDSPFAYVAWSDDKTIKGRFTFHLNSENVQKLTPDDRAFVCIHETFHVILNHDKLDLKDKKKANIAADIVINDYLVKRGLPKMEGILYGESTLGYNSYGLSVAEVYDLLPDPPTIMMIAFGSGGGNLTEEGHCGHMDDHDDCDGSGQNIPDGAFNPKDFPEFSDFFRAQADDKGTGGKLAGTGQTDLQEWSKEKGVTLKWADLLDKLDPNIFKTTGNLGHVGRSWHRLNRKVAYAAPRVMLPVPRPNNKKDGKDGEKKPTIVMAIDTSVSITENQRRRFFTLVNSIPTDKLDLECCSFSDGYTPFDPKVKFEFRSGGTNFSAIEQFIRTDFMSKYNTYPKAVVVITDGQAVFRGLQPQVPGNWFWLLDPRLSDLPANIRGVSGGHFLLNDFTT